MKRTIKINDRVKVRKDSAFYNITSKMYNQCVTGTVVRLKPWNLNNPIEEHGFIEVRLDSGDIDSWAYYNWHEHLEIINKEKH